MKSQQATNDNNPRIPLKIAISPGRPTKRPDIAVLSKLYESHTAREIAAIYGVSTATVRGWIYQYRRKDEDHACHS